MGIYLSHIKIHSYCYLLQRHSHQINITDRESVIEIYVNSYSASHDNCCTEKLLNRAMTAQWEGMGDVGSARYDPALLPPCPTIRVLCYSNCQRSTHSVSNEFQKFCTSRVKRLKAEIHSVKEIKLIFIYTVTPSVEATPLGIWDIWTFS